MTMGDRICVMRDGLIMQTADPLTLYRQPENLFVASFIGSPPMNLLRGKVQRGDGGLVFATDGVNGDALRIPLRGEAATRAGRYVDKTNSVIARIPGEKIFHHDEPLTVQLNLNKVHLFDAETEAVIR